VQPGETVTIRGTIESVKTVPTRSRITIQKAVVKDDTGTIALTWFNQRYIINILEHASCISASGRIEKTGKSLIMKPLEYEVLEFLDSKTKHTGMVVPVYPAVYGLSSKTIRDKVCHVLDATFFKSKESVEFIPDDILKEHSLMSLDQAIQTIHQPTQLGDVDAARKRLGFDELFIRILSSRLIKNRWKKEQTTVPLTLNAQQKKDIKTFVAQLPFSLTNAQNRVTQEIIADLQKPNPMNRFLQGDVGSGKTVVAAIAAYVSYLNQKQTLIMAPTEILAQQHFETISRLVNDFDISVALQTGSHKDITSKKAATAFDIIIGTHALISAKYDFGDVGLVVIDEQHRFGVKQRALLKEKGINPHLLTMTATPIPRTVSLTLYSELDLSMIDELPKGRKTIKTYVTPAAKRMAGYKWIEKQIREEKVQAYIICPLIETSERESMTSIRAAKEEYGHLKKDIFPTLNVALLHGKMKAKEKKEVMDQFNQKKYDILVSTSVVEVGVDVPNATIMLIEGAERFGLAQLHQLRGRVGRAEKQSYCLLFTSPKNEKNARLKFFAQTTSGHKLAEYDMKIRGPGEIYGTEQHGYSDLKLADLTDTKLVLMAKNAVDAFLAEYSIDTTPNLKRIIDSYQLNLIEKN